MMFNVHVFHLRKIKKKLESNLPPTLIVLLNKMLGFLLRTQLFEFFIAKPNFIGSYSSFSPNKRTILIVSHEGSRTGAPILGYNLVQELAKKYNVVAMFLGPGPILNECAKLGVVVIGPFFIQGSGLICQLAIKKVAKDVGLDFAIVNSIESRHVLPALSLYQIPTITLIHEFASYTLPTVAFKDAVNYSDEVVFSTRIVLDNMLNKLPSLNFKSYPILPQGRCLLPLDSDESCENVFDHFEKIKYLIRPKDFPEDGIVIVGAGTVQYRKGVDLFIDCAKKILDLDPYKTFRFVWIGNGYDPYNDPLYSVYLADQIIRSGLESHVYFIGEISSFDAVYESADIFILTSRLDPLPNVAIDALYGKLPVVCFDNTTGIAEILTEAGLGKLCVAKYLDVNDMAKKVVCLAQSGFIRIDTGELSLKLALSKFNMANYIGKLEGLALNQRAKVNQMSNDAEVILNSKLINWSYYNSPYFDVETSKLQAVKSYINSWKREGCRKPFPGFHPGVYLEQHGITTAKSDPFADYLKCGQPHGDWTVDVISSEDVSPAICLNARVALHIHVYYTDLLPEIIKRLNFNSTRVDLLISVSNETDRLTIEDYLSCYSEGKIHIRVVPNRGRNIGPFLTGFGDFIQENYDFVGHVHTKKSLGTASSLEVRTWWNFLLENLLGNETTKMMDRILPIMVEDPTVGMVFPDDPNAIGWSQNKFIAERLAIKLGCIDLPNSFIFPVGSMFWARVSALRPLFELKLKWSDYPSEPLPYDGTLLHAIERLFSCVVKSSGYRLVTTYVQGITR